MMLRPIHGVQGMQSTLDYLWHLDGPKESGEGSPAMSREEANAMADPRLCEMGLRQGTQCTWLQSLIVFESLVRSGFSLQNRATATATGLDNSQIWATADWTDTDWFFSVFCIPGLFRTGFNQILDRTGIETGCPMY